MKRTIKTLSLFTFILIAFSGCYLKSVHPLITTTQSVFIEGLNGVYESEDQRWTFTSDPTEAAKLLEYWDDKSVEFTADEGDEVTLGWDGYLVLFESLESTTGSPILFFGNTGTIDGNKYLNLKVFDVGEGSYDDSFTFKVNTFSKIKLDGDNLEMAFFASKWIKDQILNNRLRIKHEVIEDTFAKDTEILITASNNELRDFVEKYGNEEDAFDDPVQLKRVPKL